MPRFKSKRLAGLVPQVKPPVQEVVKPFSLSIDIQNTPENVALLKLIGQGNAHATEALASVLSNLFIQALHDKVLGEWRVRLDQSPPPSAFV